MFCILNSVVSNTILCIYLSMYTIYIIFSCLLLSMLHWNLWICTSIKVICTDGGASAALFYYFVCTYFGHTTYVDSPDIVVRCVCGLVLVHTTIWFSCQFLHGAIRLLWSCLPPNLLSSLKACFLALIPTSPFLYYTGRANTVEQHHSVVNYNIWFGMPCL